MNVGDSNHCLGVGEGADDKLNIDDYRTKVNLGFDLWVLVSLTPNS